MNFKKGIIFLTSLFTITACGSLYGQVADSMAHAVLDTAHHITDTIQKQTTAQQLADTISKNTDTTAVKNTPLPKSDSIAPSNNNNGGYVINGRVEDVHTSEGIPFATILFLHSQKGMVADINGNFVMKTNVLPGDTLRIQAVGYKTIDRVMRKDRHEYNMVIEMERSAMQLNDVVVSAEGVDPALLLLRHIIHKKPVNNPDRAENYKYEAHNLLEVDLQRLTKSQFEKIPILKKYAFVYNNLDTVSERKPFLPLYLTETVSDYYFQRSPKKQKEFIKGSIIKGVNNQYVVKYLGTLYQNVNVYRNYIPVFDKKFVSPINDNGPFFYKYAIKDTERAYGHNIILVQFTPRRQGENCFTGDFWVVDSVYAIQRVNLELPKLANIDWVDNVNIYQEFAPVANDSLWFCIKDKFIASFSAYNSNILPGMIGRKTTTYHNIVINDTSVTDVLDDKKWKTDVIVDDSSKNRSDAWWANTRPDSLTQNEKKIYKMVDTINQMPITTKYKNFITFLASGVKDFGPIELGPYFYIYSNNSVEGNRYRLSLATPRKLKDIHFTGFLAYGDLDKRFKYGITGLWVVNRKPWTTIFGSYIHDIDHSTNYYDQLGSDNIFTTLFRKPDIPWKLAFTDEQRIELFKEYYNGFSNKLILLHRTFMPFSPLPFAGIFFDNNGNPSNQVVSTEAQVELRYAYKEKFLDGLYYRTSLGSKYPIVDLQLGAGFKNVIDGGYDYQKIRLAVTEDINIPPFGHIYYNLFAGKYFGTLPYPLLEIHPGNEFLYYNPYAFEMMNTYEFISDKYAGFNIEHTIGGGIFNYIPLLKRLKWRQFWTAKGVIGSLSDANEKLNFTPAYTFRSLQGDPYVELGTGISNIFHIFRIDFVWRVAPPLLPTESQSRYFGVFGSVRFAF